MHELIPITTSIIGQEEANTVNARKLHHFLEVETRFNDWILRRIEEFGFEQHHDFEVLLKNGEKPLGGRPSKEYHLTLDMAKELSMLERSSMGRVARKYFIKKERQANNTDQIITELLHSNPLWRNIKRYTKMGLTRTEICRLVALNKETVRRHLRRMENLGIITPPPNLKELQAMAQRLLPGMEA